MSNLFVLRNKEDGRYSQTGYSATEDLQAAVVYSRKGRYGWMLDAAPEDFTGWSAKVEVIPVKIVPAG